MGLTTAERRHILPGNSLVAPDKRCGTDPESAGGPQRPSAPQLWLGSALDVLVLDAEHRQTLAAVRSFGRRGLRVGAAGSDVHALSCRSRWCSFRAALPVVEADLDAYADAVELLVEQRSVGVVIPAYDGSIEALRRRRSTLGRRTTLALASEDALSVAVSKERTLRLAEALKSRVPRSISISSLSDVGPAIRDLGCPTVVKPAHSWAESNGVGRRLSPTLALSLEEAQRWVAEMLESGTSALLQEWLPGRREAVSLFYAKERFWACFAQVSHREWPLLGGCSVFCESIPLSDDIAVPATDLIRAMNLEGPSMVEFRRDSAGEAVLMEVNPRMGGSVALAIASGVDFPGLTYDWATGQPLHAVAGYRPGRRARWLAGDLLNLKCSFQEPLHPDSNGPVRALGTFISDLVPRPSRVDPFSLRDFRPGVVDLQTVVFSRARAKLARLGKAHGEAHEE